MIYGLTGIIASGKSTVSRYFLDKGEYVIDCDKIAREVMEKKEVLEKIVETFGNEVMENGILNRKKLREKVFDKKEEVEKLNKIMHGEILKETRRLIQKNIEKEIIIVDMPLLFEVGFQNEVDKVIVVYSDEKSVVDRIIQRDKTTRENAENVLKRQMSIDEKAKKADFLLMNIHSFEAFQTNIENLYLKIKKSM